MALLDRGQSVAAVFVGIGLTPDAEQTEVEQPEGRSQCSFAGHSWQLQERADLGSSSGQAPTHLENPVVLGPVALLPPVRVVEVLAPAGGVRPDGLQVAVGQRADPHVLPGGGDHQCLATSHVGGIEAPTVLVEVGEPASVPTPHPPR